MRNIYIRLLGIVVSMAIGAPCTAQADDTTPEQPLAVAADSLQQDYTALAVASQAVDITPAIAEADDSCFISIDTIASAAGSNTLRKKSKPCIYELPYSVKTQCPDYKRMWINTGVLFAGGLTALAVLELLPEDATAWNKEELRRTPFFKRWSKHVKQGPVWDGDDYIFNYVLHPYAGAAYYMGARSVGFNVLGSFIYCTAISTVFWEYGIEAFMEIPSLQDLIITPVAGLIVGEGFYRLKRHIVDHGYRLFGSKLLGNIVAFIIDPVNEVIGLFNGNPARQLAKRRTEISAAPWMVGTSGGAMGLSLRIGF